MQSKSIASTMEDAFVAQLKHFEQVIRGNAKSRINAVDATNTLRATLGGI